MSFQKLVKEIVIYFPNFRIKYKNESILMKILGFILFFNPAFMKEYTTTIGSTVYFPSEFLIKTRPVSSAITILHELIHVYDAKRINKYLFFCLYLFPRILIIIALPLFFLNWQIALILSIISIAPTPAYFRMIFEKRAYLASLYTMFNLGKKLSFDPDLESQKDIFIKQFKGSAYYYMWIFSDIESDFNNAIRKINTNHRPFEDSFFDTLDKLILKM